MKQYLLYTLYAFLSYCYLQLSDRNLWLWRQLLYNIESTSCRHRLSKISLFTSISTFFARQQWWNNDGKCPMWSQSLFKNTQIIYRTKILCIRFLFDCIALVEFFASWTCDTSEKRKHTWQIKWWFQNQFRSLHVLNVFQCLFDPLLFWYWWKVLRFDLLVVLVRK